VRRELDSPSRRRRDRAPGHPASELTGAGRTQGDATAPGAAGGPARTG
jgi:hypothetical protein